MALHCSQDISQHTRTCQIFAGLQCRRPTSARPHALKHHTVQALFATVTCHTHETNTSAQHRADRGKAIDDEQQAETKLNTVQHYSHNSQQSTTSLLAHRVSSSRCYNNLNSHLSFSELFDSRLTDDVGARSGNSTLFSPVSHHVMISPLPCERTHTYTHVGHRLCRISSTKSPIDY